MRLILQPGQFRFGKSAVGAIVGIPKDTLDLFKNPLWQGLDIMTMWVCYVKNEYEIERVELEVEWVNKDLTIVIPFNPKFKEEREVISKICEEHGLAFVNAEDDDPGGVKMISSGVWVQVELTQVLDWFAWEESGMSLTMWKDKNPRFKI